MSVSCERRENHARNRLVRGVRQRGGRRQQTPYRAKPGVDRWASPEKKAGNPILRCRDAPYVVFSANQYDELGVRLFGVGGKMGDGKVETGEEGSLSFCDKCKKNENNLKLSFSRAPTNFRNTRSRVIQPSLKQTIFEYCSLGGQLCCCRVTHPIHLLERGLSRCAVACCAAPRSGPAGESHPLPGSKSDSPWRPTCAHTKTFDLRAS